MKGEFEKILNQEKEILATSPRIYLMVAGFFLIAAIVLMILDVASPEMSRVGAACGACFGIVAMGFVAYVRSVQSKLNLAIIEAIQELRAESGREG